MAFACPCASSGAAAAPAEGLHQNPRSLSLALSSSLKLSVPRAVKKVNAIRFPDQGAEEKGPPPVRLQVPDFPASAGLPLAFPAPLAGLPSAGFPAPFAGLPSEGFPAPFPAWLPDAEAGRPALGPVLPLPFAGELALWATPVGRGGCSLPDQGAPWSCSRCCWLRSPTSPTTRTWWLPVADQPAHRFQRSGLTDPAPLPCAEAG